MKKRSLIQGVWYVVEAEPSKDSDPNALLVLAGERDWAFTKKTGYLTKSEVKDICMIMEGNVNPWNPLENRLVKRQMTMDRNVYDGIGMLGISRHYIGSEKLITPDAASAIKWDDTNDKRKLNAELYIVLYNPLNVCNRPYEQTSIIARDEIDLLNFANASQWSVEQILPIKRAFKDKTLNFEKGLIVMPEVITGYQHKLRFDL